MLRQSIAENFAYSHSASSSQSFSPLLGGKTETERIQLFERLHGGLWAAEQHGDAGLEPSRSTASNYFTNTAVESGAGAG